MGTQLRHLINLGLIRWWSDGVDGHRCEKLEVIRFSLGVQKNEQADVARDSRTYLARPNLRRERGRKIRLLRQLTTGRIDNQNTVRACLNIEIESVHKICRQNLSKIKLCDWPNKLDATSWQV